MSTRRGDTWADVTSETTQLWCVTNNLVGTPHRADQPGLWCFRARYPAICQTEMCSRLSFVKGSRFQLLQRSRKVSPASRAIRSSSDGHT